MMNSIQNLLDQVAIIGKKHEELLDATGGRFNVFRMCGVDHYENRHSAILAELLRPDGTHGLKETFLACFVGRFCEEGFRRKFDCTKACVATEYATAKHGRMDILIEDQGTKCAIIIENKVYASDGHEQLKGYDSFAKDKYGEGNYVIFYLTLQGDDPSKDSGKGVKYTRISYKDDMIRWLEECVGFAARLPTVRETLFQYINHLKSLTGQDMNAKYKEEVIRLLCENPKNVESAFAIGDSFTEMKNYLVNEVFLPKLTSLCKALNLENTSQKGDMVNTPYTGFSITNPSWRFFQIAFEFGRTGLGNLCIGVIPKERNVKNAETYATLKQRYPKNSNDVWAYYQYFTTYRDWGKDAMLAIHTGTMVDVFKDEIVKLLELTKGLAM